MTISIDPATFVINIPKSELTLIQASPIEIREMNLNEFRLALKDWEDDGVDGGITFLKTHDHNTEISLGGLTYARVVEILDPYSITFEDGQYAVNLVGANSNVGDKVNVNQVSIRSANSAGLISTPLIEYNSFEGGVTVDIVNGLEGTIFPIGTPRNPVKTLSDALLIAEYRGFHYIYIKGDITLDSGTDFTEYTFMGESPSKTTITIEDDANVEFCEFYDAEITGILDGENVLKDCLIKNITYINGFIERCILGSGTTVLGGNKESHFLDCWSGVVGSATPVIDMGGTGQGLGMRNYTGGIKLINKSGSEKVSIDLASGQVVLDSTITNGEIVARGDGKIIDTSGNNIFSGAWNGCTIINETTSVTNATTVDILKLSKNKITRNGNIITIYEDDNVTPWKTFDLSNLGRVET